MVHVKQRETPSAFDELYRKWGFQSVSIQYLKENIPKSIYNRIRINPDELPYYRFWVWKNKVMPLVIYSSIDVTQIDQVMYIGLDWNDKTQRKNMNEWNEYIDYFGIEHNNYHPIEILAEYQSMYFMEVIGDTNPNKIINNSADSNSFNDKLSSILSAYQIADCVWLAIQDKSSNMSYYSKRLILSKIIIRTIKIFITDDSLDISKTKKFIDQEINKVMAFENLKKQSKEKINLIVNKIKNNSCIADINTEKQHSINNAVKKISDFVNKLPFFRLRK